VARILTVLEKPFGEEPFKTSLLTRERLKPIVNILTDGLTSLAMVALLTGNDKII
jgi:hypothetical protein